MLIFLSGVPSFLKFREHEANFIKRWLTLIADTIDYLISIYYG